MQKRRLGIDIDGTITCPSTFIPYINNYFQLNLSLKDLTVYDLATVIGVTNEEFYKWLRAHEVNIYKDAKIVDSHVMSVLNGWTKMYELFFISARHNDYFDLTKDWFLDRSVPFHHIELIGKHDKLEAVKKHKIEIFFEDKHDNACNISEECDIPVILFNAPYNQEPVPSKVIRVNNWLEASQWVNQYFKSSV